MDKCKHDWVKGNILRQCKKCDRIDARRTYWKECKKRTDFDWSFKCGIPIFVGTCTNDEDARINANLRERQGLDITDYVDAMKEHKNKMEILKKQV